MSVSDGELLHYLSWIPFVDTAELAMALGETHVAIHRGLARLLSDGIAGRVSHGTAHLPSSRRYYPTAQGIREAAGMLGFHTPSDFMRVYPVPREWLTLIIRRMDAVASGYRLGSSISPGTAGQCTQVAFDRWGRFDTTIIRHGGRSFGVCARVLPCGAAPSTTGCGPSPSTGTGTAPVITGIALRAMSSQQHHQDAITTVAAMLTADTARSRDHDLLELLLASRSSVNYHYQGTDYVVHPGYLLAVPCPAFRPWETPASTRSGSAAAVLLLSAHSTVQPCSTPPSVQAIGDGAPAIRR